MGSKAQKEDLCHSTTLYESLMAAVNDKEYPLQEFEAIYSPKACSHQNIDAGSFACISMAGYRVTKGRVDPSDYPGKALFAKGMEEKIRVILSTLISHGHTNIVLGALGCGAFAKDNTGIAVPHIPVDVARAFNEVLNSTYIDGIPYAKHFQNIVFAILETPRQEFLNPIFKDTLRTASKTSTVVSIQPTPLQYAATSNATGFDTSSANVERLFKQQTKFLHYLVELT